MIGTPGQERIEATRCDSSLFLSESDTAPESLPRHTTLHKKEFDFFTHQHANSIIQSLKARDPLFVVYGVATDYCVVAAVEGLLSRGCRVAIVADAIRPIDALAEAELLTDFVRRGVLLTITDAVCDPQTRLSLDRPSELPDAGQSASN